MARHPYRSERLLTGIGFFAVDPTVTVFGLQANERLPPLPRRALDMTADKNYI
jgi:hypothetical protein